MLMFEELIDEFDGSCQMLLLRSDHIKINLHHVICKKVIFWKKKDGVSCHRCCLIFCFVFHGRKCLSNHSMPMLFREKTTNYDLLQRQQEANMQCNNHLWWASGCGKNCLKSLGKRHRKTKQKTTTTNQLTSA